MIEERGQINEWLHGCDDEGENGEIVNFDTKEKFIFTMDGEYKMKIANINNIEDVIPKFLLDEMVRTCKFHRENTKIDICIKKLKEKKERLQVKDIYDFLAKYENYEITASQNISTCPICKKSELSSTYNKYHYTNNKKSNIEDFGEWYYVDFSYTGHFRLMIGKEFNRTKICFWCERERGYEDECSCCRGGGCVHCEPHRFVDFPIYD